MSAPEAPIRELFEGCDANGEPAWWVLEMSPAQLAALDAALAGDGRVVDFAEFGRIVASGFGAAGPAADAALRGDATG